MSFFDYSVFVNKSNEFGICENKTSKEQPALIMTIMSCGMLL